MIECSICMATYNQAKELRRTLDSIVRQAVPFWYEIIVADDGSTDDTPAVCREFPVRYTRLERPSPAYRNPCHARNAAFRLAAGRVVIAQSSDVEHHTPDAITRLVAHLTPTTITMARVKNVAADGTVGWDYNSYQPSRIAFYLGALWRADVFAVGGQDEDFVEPYYEDNWFAKCLRHLGRTPKVCHDVIGYHHAHPVPDLAAVETTSRRLYFRKLRMAKEGRHPWTARTGPWPMNGASA